MTSLLCDPEGKRPSVDVPEVGHGLQVYSDSSVLYVDCQDLGTFPMRVKVSNEHSSAFYEFKLHINSPYEEGITVLSESGDGTGMLSFMRQMADGTMGNLKLIV